jgi:hypothetical protein
MLITLKWKLPLEFYGPQAMQARINDDLTDQCCFSFGDHAYDQQKDHNRTEAVV